MILAASKDEHRIDAGNGQNLATFQSRVFLKGTHPGHTQSGNGMAEASGLRNPWPASLNPTKTGKRDSINFSFIDEDTEVEKDKENVSRSHR